MTCSPEHFWDLLQKLPLSSSHILVIIGNSLSLTTPFSGTNPSIISRETSAYAKTLSEVFAFIAPEIVSELDLEEIFKIIFCVSLFSKNSKNSGETEIYSFKESGIIRVTFSKSFVPEFLRYKILSVFEFVAREMLKNFYSK